MVVIRVILTLLPYAEVFQSGLCIEGDSGSIQLILYNDQLHNNNVNQVSNAGVLIDGGNDGHQGKNVVLKVASMMFHHLAVCHNHDFNKTGVGEETL